MRRLHLWKSDFQYVIATNILTGLLMILMPHDRTTGPFYGPARRLLEWLPIYPFIVYGVLAFILAGMIMAAAFRPVLLSVVLALGVGYWAFWTIIFVFGLVTAGSSGGIGLIAILGLSQTRRHYFLFPARVNRLQ